MSKIYEALERAEQIPHGTKLPDAMPPRSPWRRRLYIARRKEAEKGVVGFCQRVEAFPLSVKKVIQFVGSHGRRDAITEAICCNLCL
jgi:hypothetical protein